MQTGSAIVRLSQTCEIGKLNAWWSWILYQMSRESLCVESHMRKWYVQDGYLYKQRFRQKTFPPYPGIMVTQTRAQILQAIEETRIQREAIQVSPSILRSIQR